MQDPLPHLLRQGALRCNPGTVTRSRLGDALRAVRTTAATVKSRIGWRPRVYLTEDEAEAMDLLLQAHESGTPLTAASSGVDRTTLEGLLAKGAVESVDRVHFALTSHDLSA